MPRAIVIGAGVAGPAVAQLLTRRGWDAPVFESRAKPDAFEGLFLNVAANGQAVLATLGAKEHLFQDAHPAAEMVMWSGRRKRLGVVPNGPPGRPGDGGVIVRRGWLHGVIRAAAEEAGVVVHHGQTMVDLTQHSNGVSVRFADGHTEHADIVIGADGVGSDVRRCILPGVEPTFTGLIGTGGFATVPGLPPTPGRQHFVFGARSFFGYLVRENGIAYWFANLSSARPPSPCAAQDSERWRQQLLDLHRDDPEPVPQILANTHRAIGVYPIFDLRTIPAWSQGRSVLIGDAVHATDPSAGQGASLALEDAVALARCLTHEEKPQDAFQAYESSRRERVEQVVAYAASIGDQKKVTTTWVGTALRDALLPFVLRKATSDDSHNWIYDYTA